MTKYVFFLLISCMPAYIFGQEIAPSTDSPNPIRTIEPANPSVVISEHPTVQDIADLIVGAQRGEVDPFLAIPRIVNLGDSVVPLLELLLLTDTIRGSYQTRPHWPDSVNAFADPPAPDKELAAWALRSIRTSSSYAVILSATETLPNSPARFVILQSLATDFLDFARSRESDPDRMVIQLFLQLVDDTTMMPGPQQRISELAQAAFTSWTGELYGNIPEALERRSAWWRDVGSQMIWDRVEGRYKRQ